MRIDKISDMKGGWFVGNFKPSAYNTKDFEVGFKTYKKGEEHSAHYHKIATEINCLIRGSMLVNDQKIHAGEIFTIDPNEVCECYFLEDCELIVVKTTSDSDDKYISN